MALFENMLLLLTFAVLLLQLSRRLFLPYPAILALAGCAVAALPWAPRIQIEPHLALALFVAPALLDAAFGTAPRELRRNWLPLLALVVFAVLLTAAAVAWAGWTIGGLPIAAAITLGAIVAPPDAVAANAVMQSFRLPRRTVSIINGESLLNDAVALLLFGAAVSAATSEGSATASTVTMLLIAAPGGALAGFLMGKVRVHLAAIVSGTLSSTLLEFLMTFGTWILAERLHLSPIIAVVALAMTVARYVPSRSPPRDRIHSYSVWNSTVFLLNVLAFLLMGLQARDILSRLGADELGDALRFAGLVLVIVIGVRVTWVMIYGVLVRTFQPLLARLAPDAPIPTVRIGLLVGWSGMRGLVTMAAAFALPADFPGRDLIVLSAFAVVLGTLTMQGLTIGPLIRLLRLKPDDSFDREVSGARTRMLDAALQAVADESGEAAAAVQAEYRSARATALDETRPHEKTEHDRIRLIAIGAQRAVLEQLRRDGQIDDDAYHRLEEELDWLELSATPTHSLRLQSV